MKIYYDLHIHSALSPCADDSMTPNNIVNMSLIKGLDIIAVTDHNSCGNVRSILKAAEGTGLVVVPGIELETSEEVHVLCYFESIEAAGEMEQIILKSRKPIKNRIDIFGNQLYFDSDDHVIGTEDRLLSTASGLSFSKAINEVIKLGGVPVPAHIDRPSFSVISNLGFMPETDSIKTVEATGRGAAEIIKQYHNYRVIINSDAHTLGDISEKEYCLDIMHKKAEKILKYL
jgi:PHP family Zn ribbon phosphoesterase